MLQSLQVLEIKWNSLKVQFYSKLKILVQKCQSQDHNTAAAATKQYLTQELKDVF